MNNGEILSSLLALLFAGLYVIGIIFLAIMQHRENIVKNVGRRYFASNYAKFAFFDIDFTSIKSNLD